MLPSDTADLIRSLAAPLSLQGASLSPQGGPLSPQDLTAIPQELGDNTNSKEGEAQPMAENEYSSGGGASNQLIDRSVDKLFSSKSQ